MDMNKIEFVIIIFLICTLLDVKCRILSLWVAYILFVVYFMSSCNRANNLNVEGIEYIINKKGAWGGVVVKALRY